MPSSLHKNIGKRFSDIILYVQLASQKGISNRAKSAYNRAAIILASTVVEGLVFSLIQKETGETAPIILSEPETKTLHRIPVKVLNRSDIIICQERTRNIHLSDRQCTFSLMNRYCRDKKFVNEKQYKRLEYVRSKRNELHVQTLTGNDRGHTTKTLDLIGEAVGFLLNKL